MIRDVGADKLYAANAGVETSGRTTDTTTGTLANAIDARVGGGGPTGYSTMTCMAVFVARRALTAGELYAIGQYYGSVS
jgi:hypothetical protein